MNFIDRKESELEKSLNELTRQAKSNQIREIVIMLKSDEFEMLKDQQNQQTKNGEFVSYSDLVNGCNGKVEYIESVISRLEQKIADLT